MLLEESFPESLKLTNGCHFPSISRCPCGGDVDPDEPKCRIPARAGADVPVIRIVDGFGAMELGELDSD